MKIRTVFAGKFSNTFTGTRKIKVNGHTIRTDSGVCTNPSTQDDNNQPNECNVKVVFQLDALCYATAVFYRLQLRKDDGTLIKDSGQRETSTPGTYVLSLTTLPPEPKPIYMERLYHFDRNQKARPVTRKSSQ